MEFNATFIVSVISFIIFTLLMNEILYKPVSKIIEEREHLINDNYENAKASKDHAGAIYADRDEKLSKTAAENKKLTAESLTKANADAKIKTTEAKQNSIAQINAAKSDIQNKSDALNNEVKGRIDELADNISAKILGEV